MATEVGSTAAMPHLQSVQKAMALPAVGAAVEQVGALYHKVKGAHSLLEWALSTAEASVSLAAVTAAPYMAAPLSSADARVAAAIEQLEKRVPLVTEQPKVIAETTKQAVLAKVSPHVNKVFQARAAAEQRVKSLKELTWAKANVLLSTAYGQKAMQGVDTGAVYAMKFLDHYLPAVGPQEVSDEIVSATNDPALHTVQTVGRLSSVAARRVWANLACKINELRKSGYDLDVRRYVTALLAALHLADVTRQQHDMTNLTSQSAPPKSQPIPQSNVVTSFENNSETNQSQPKTSSQVKTTPEGKSKKSAKSVPKEVNSE